MKTIVLTSGKSGCGTTSVAAALSAALAARNKKTLLIEMQAGFRELPRLLGLPLENLFDVSDVLEGRSSLADAEEEVPGQGFHLLQGASELDWLPRTEALTALGKATGDRYDFFIIDCPAGAGPVQKRLAPAADLVAFVTTVAALPLETAEKAAFFWSEAGALRQKILFNKLGRRMPADAGVRNLDEAMDRIGASLLGIIPPEENLFCSEAVQNIAARLSGSYRPLLPQYLK